MSPHCKSAGDCVTVQFDKCLRENFMTESIFVPMIKDDGFKLSESLCFFFNKIIFIKHFSSGFNTIYLFQKPGYSSHWCKATPPALWQLQKLACPDFKWLEPDNFDKCILCHMIGSEEP